MVPPKCGGIGKNSLISWLNEVREFLKLNSNLWQIAMEIHPHTQDCVCRGNSDEKIIRLFSSNIRPTVEQENGNTGRFLLIYKDPEWDEPPNVKWIRIVIDLNNRIPTIVTAFNNAHPNHNDIETTKLYCTAPSYLKGAPNSLPPCLSQKKVRKVFKC